MTKQDAQHAARHAGQLMSGGYHCSEAIVQAVGKYTMGDVDEVLCRASSGFSGGVGNTHQQLCGALSGGVLLIGALHGRLHKDTDDSLCIRLAARYRDVFEETFGSACCCELKDIIERTGKPPSCDDLVEQAAQVLIDVLENDQNEG
ncbi:MAG: C_GCAxxG_C_C family protein [Anaerolineae bacterium]|nr:C_GCAxxG_C_C family protein [Anaerolineae bacterium]